MNQTSTTQTERKDGQVLQPIITQSNKLLFSIRDAAQILSMSEKSVRRLIERGLLKVNPALRIKLVTAESIRAFAKMTL